DVITMSQDFRGNLLSLANNNSNLSMGRDATGRLTEVTTGATPFQPPTTISYTYDTRDRIIARQELGAHTVSYTRNPLGLATQIADDQAGATSIAYDARTARVSQLYPN